MKSGTAQLARQKKYDESHRDEKHAYYASHKEERLAYRAAYADAHRDEMRQERAEFTEWLQILRTVNGCEDCETHEGWLEHHHVDPDTKKYEISKMPGFSLDALEDELEKCVVLCRACHKKRHLGLPDRCKPIYTEGATSNAV